MLCLVCVSQQVVSECTPGSGCQVTARVHRNTRECLLFSGVFKAAKVCSATIAT